MPRRPPACPRCRSTDTVRITYGYPTTEAQMAAERGEIALGGCCITGDDPTWHCKACGRDFWRGRGTGDREQKTG